MGTHHCNELRVLWELQLERDGTCSAIVEGYVRDPTRLDGVGKGRWTEGNKKETVWGLALAGDVDRKVLTLPGSVGNVERVRGDEGEIRDRRKDGEDAGGVWHRPDGRRKTKSTPLLAHERPD